MVEEAKAKARINKREAAKKAKEEEDVANALLSLTPQAEVEALHALLALTPAYG